MHETIFFEQRTHRVDRKHELFDVLEELETRRCCVDGGQQIVGTVALQIRVVDVRRLELPHVQHEKIDLVGVSARSYSQRSRCCTSA